MRNSIFLRRIILLLAAAVVLSGLLSAGLYMYVMQHVYVGMQSDELLPIARDIAEYYSEGDQEDTHGNPFFSPSNRGFLGAKLAILDLNGNYLYGQGPEGNGGKDKDFTRNKSEDFSPPDQESLGPSPVFDDVTSLIIPALQTTGAGEELVTQSKSQNGEGYLVVGVPIWSADGGAVTGSVVFTKKLSEFNESLQGLQVTLLISTFLTFVIMLIPGYFFARKLAIPVQQMRDVSLRMAKGDFSTRADESQKGELGDLAVSINRFAEETQRLDKTRQDYVSNVSHELRTPIAAIRAMGETLSDGMIRDESKKKQYYEHILRESMRLSRLVDDLLELSRLQSGGVALKKSVFSLEEILQNCADVYGEMAAETDITLELAMDAASLPPVYSNSDRIEQVLVVLLDNAIKHTPEGGKVTLDATADETKVTVTVTDTGEGIPEQDLSYVFDRFYKVDKSHSSGGTGLGLSIASELLQLLKETIMVESPEGGGARFAFTIHRKI